MSQRSYPIGIDLGTTNSCVAVYKAKKTFVIFNDSGLYITPSYVSFTESETLVGDEALNQMPLNLENTVYDAKRLIGRQVNDPIVQEDIKMWPFPVKEGKNGQSMIEISGKDGKRLIYPEFISSLVLKKMKKISETFLGEKVNDAIITVPAHFNDAQRRATQDAGRAAGLNVVKIIDEPTAAAIAYGINQEFGEDKINVLVYDLGGGTFDVSILTMEDGIFEVKSTNGNTHLGGQDFTNSLVNYCIKDIEITTRKNVTTNKTAMAYLRLSCEAAKKALSFRTKATVILKHESYHYSKTITRAEFENLNEELFKSTLTYVRLTLTDARMKTSDIDDILLIGGSTRIPKIQSILGEMFVNKTFSNSLNPDHGVAIGAAIQAALSGGKTDNKEENVKLVDVIPMPLGIETIMNGERNYAIGIDLATTNACVAVYKDGKTTVISNDSGLYITPSVVTFTESETLVDDETVKQMPLNPESTIYNDLNRRIGKIIFDNQEDTKRLPFKVKTLFDSKLQISIPGKMQHKMEEYEMTTFTSSLILKKLKSISEKFLGQKVYDAVITVPEHFNYEQIVRLKDAAKDEGLNIIEHIYASKAAVIAYGIVGNSEKKNNILVYSLRRNTFDVSITSNGEIPSHVYLKYNPHLGGQDFTNNLLNYCINDIANELSMILTVDDIISEKVVMALLRSSCEGARKVLSFQKQATVALQYGSIDYARTITRDKFESLNKELFESTLRYVQNVLKDASKRISDIDEVILIEESSRIPKIRTMLREMFVNKPVHASINPGEEIAIGAAIFAEELICKKK